MQPEPESDAPSAEIAESVFAEVRRSRSGGSLARSIGIRVLGLVVLAIAAWVISRNVTWTDTLRLEAPTGAAELPGAIDGDWRDGTVGFLIAADADVEGALDGVGVASAALAQATRDGVVLTVTASAVRNGAGDVVVTTDTGVAGGGLSRIEWRPGMLRVLREVRVVGLIPALGFLILASLCVVTRWWRLLALNGCPTRWYDAFRYTYSGLFFNAVVPGFNGGDVARAYAVVRSHPTRRADALMTVVVDRVVGLIAMILIGTFCVLTTDDRLAALKPPVTLFTVAVLVGGALFFSGRVRRLVRFDALVTRLPQGDRLLRLDSAAQRLMRSPGDMAVALGFSFCNHLATGLAVMAVASALGSDLGFRDWLSTMAIANTLSSIPLSPGGLGVGEILYGSLARSLGSTYAIGVATSLVYRLCLYVMSLIGGLVMLLPAAKAGDDAV